MRTREADSAGWARGQCPLDGIDAMAIAQAQGGRRVGTTWMARCPAHDDRKPSLSIKASDKLVLVHCHAGCTQHEVIDALRALGLWEHASRATTVRPTASSQQRQGGQQLALRLWKSAVASHGTLVETYLRARGIAVPLPDALRFCDALRHPLGGRWPGMVALVTRGVDGTPIAIHRTYLARDGSDKAPIELNKMMLGPCRGGAVRLGPTRDRLMVAEGIETALSAVQATGQSAWAALSTSGLRTLDLPVEVTDIVILADGDEPGESAAQGAGQRWRREGRRVRIARPPQGQDFNDVLRGYPPCRIEGRA